MDTRKPDTAPAINRPSILPLVLLTTIWASTAAIGGCRSSAIVPTAINNPSGTDPSEANLAPVNSQPQTEPTRPAARSLRVLASQQSYPPQQSPEQYPQQQQYSQQQYPQQPPAPIERRDPNQAYDDSASYDSGEADGYEALADASQPPPPLPEYDQPPVPEPNDLWTPGYWNYAPQGYYWVPGAWVAPPYIGALWTPAYWAFDGGRYRLHRGFWARHIGFYGGINYGFGYTGIGYSGGYWNGNDFFYNRAVNRVNVTNIHNVYERNITVNNITRVSYNGGAGGIHARPGPQELAVFREQRTPPMANQVQLREASSQNRQQFYNENHGRPAQPFAPHPIGRAMQTPPAQTFQQQNQRPQTPNPPFNQQQRTPGTQQQTQQQIQHPQPINPPFNQQRTTSPQPEQQQQHFEQERRAFQNQTPGRTQPQPTPSQPQQPAQPPNQQDLQRTAPHYNHQEPVNSPQRPQQQQLQQQDAGQQRQRFQQQQQAEQQQRIQQQQAEQQQRLQQQQRPNLQQAEPQRTFPQRAPESQPRPQQVPTPQPQRPQTQPQFRPQPQPHQEAPRAEPRK